MQKYISVGYAVETVACRRCCNKMILVRKEGVSVFWTLESFQASKPLVANCAS